MCDTMRDAAIFDLLYTKKEELGRGKFGTVLKVTAGDGRTFAAKIVKIRKQQTRIKIENEIQILSQLNNPHIIRYIEGFEGLCEIILVLEYLGGGELFDRVASDEFNLTETDCCLFLRQICRGVEYLHNKHIVHLDLKPENIVCYDKMGCTIKIVDFGTALHISPGEKVKVTCGTAEFVAPEIVTYDCVSPGTDMWSIGVITYILLSGYSPFMGDNDAQTFANISRLEYDFDIPEFDIISPAAKDFINRLLLKTPKHRLSAKQCLEHPWILEDKVTATVISTENLKKYLARQRWQRCGEAIRAMRRVSSMVSKRKSSVRSCTLDSQGSEVNSEDMGEFTLLPSSEPEAAERKPDPTKVKKDIVTDDTTAHEASVRNMSKSVELGRISEVGERQANSGRLVDQREKTAEFENMKRPEDFLDNVKTTEEKIKEEQDNNIEFAVLDETRGCKYEATQFDEAYVVGPGNKKQMPAAYKENMAWLSVIPEKKLAQESFPSKIILKDTKDEAELIETKVVKQSDNKEITIGYIETDQNKDSLMESPSMFSVHISKKVSFSRQNDNACNSYIKDGNKGELAKKGIIKYDTETGMERLDADGCPLSELHDPEHTEALEDKHESAEVRKNKDESSEEPSGASGIGRRENRSSNPFNILGLNTLFNSVIKRGSVTFLKSKFEQK